MTTLYERKIKLIDQEKKILLKRIAGDKERLEELATIRQNLVML